MGVPSNLFALPRLQIRVGAADPFPIEIDDEESAEALVGPLGLGFRGWFVGVLFSVFCGRLKVLGFAVSGLRLRVWLEIWGLGV